MKWFGRIVLALLGVVLVGTAGLGVTWFAWLQPFVESEQAAVQQLVASEWTPDHDTEYDRIADRTTVSWTLPVDDGGQLPGRLLVSWSYGGKTPTPDTWDETVALFFLNRSSEPSPWRVLAIIDGADERWSLEHESGFVFIHAREMCKLAKASAIDLRAYDSDAAFTPESLAMLREIATTLGCP